MADEDRSNWRKVCPTCMEGLKLSAAGTVCSCGETLVRVGDDRPDHTSLAWNSTGKMSNERR